MIGYLAIGVLLVVLLHFMLERLARTDRTKLARIGKWLLIGGVVAGIFLLFRMGLVHFASLLSGLIVIGTVLRRLYPLFPIFRWLYQRRQEKRAGQGQEGGQAGARQATGQMTREEAAQILGVPANASKKEIKEAYHRLMQKIHPDHGGSPYLASQLNQARDVLLGK